MNIYEETKFILKKYGITANKSLGQNFLIDENIIQNIIDKAKIEKEDLVIEIGPGLGTLTKYLLESAGKVIAVELDKKMVNILNDRFKLYNNFELINDDILKIDMNKLINKNSFKSVKIVANLPYYITTPIIMKLLEEDLDIESITIMIQKEVADRITAIPGEKGAGAITYSVYYYAESQKIVKVGKESFIPNPSVDSEVIKLTKRKKPPVEVKNKDLMFKIIKFAFMMRRKTLVNALLPSKLFNNKEEIIKTLKKLDLNKNVRGEELTLKNFADISNMLSLSL